MARLTRQHINRRTGVIESFMDDGQEGWHATVAPPHADTAKVDTDRSQDAAKLSADNLAHPGCSPLTCHGAWLIDDVAR